MVPAMFGVYPPRGGREGRRFLPRLRSQGPPRPERAAIHDEWPTQHGGWPWKGRFSARVRQKEEAPRLLPILVQDFWEKLGGKRRRLGAPPKRPHRVGGFERWRRPGRRHGHIVGQSDS